MRKQKKRLREETKIVLVLAMQQVLPAPHLCTNIICYKRLLSVHYLTIRDCCTVQPLNRLFALFLMK